MELAVKVRNINAEIKSFGESHELYPSRQRGLKGLEWRNCNVVSMLTLYRSSRPGVFFKKVILRNFAKFTGKHLCQSFFFNKVTGLRPATLLKRDSGTGVFL